MSPNRRSTMRAAPSSTHPAAASSSASALTCAPRTFIFAGASNNARRSIRSRRACRSTPIARSAHSAASPPAASRASFTSAGRATRFAAKTRRACARSRWPCAPCSAVSSMSRSRARWTSMAICAALPQLMRCARIRAQAWHGPSMRMRMVRYQVKAQPASCSSASPMPSAMVTASMPWCVAWARRMLVR